MGMTKQAASKLVDAMVSAGYIQRGKAKVIGTSHLARMRRDLMRILSDPGNGQLPPVRPTW
jgi:hypothetical protein